MEIIFIPEKEFVAFIKEQGVGDKANLKAIDGKFRWIITREDGSEYICRPQQDE